MYKVTIEKKEYPFSSTDLRYERRQDAFTAIEVFSEGDLKNEYKYIFEIVDETAEEAVKGSEDVLD